MSRNTTLIGLLIVCGVLVATTCVAEDRRCPATGIKRTKEYLRKSQVQCFSSPEAAERKGYDVFQFPTVTPTATPTPDAGTDYTGTWVGELTVSSDTCDDNIPGVDPVGSYQLQRSVTHSNTEVGSTIRGDERRDQVAAGVVTADGFTLTDVNSFNDCQNGYETLTETYTDDPADSNKLSVTRRADIECLTAALTCARIWSGTVTK